MGTALLASLDRYHTVFCVEMYNNAAFNVSPDVMDIKNCLSFLEIIILK